MERRSSGDLKKDNEGHYTNYIKTRGGQSPHLVVIGTEFDLFLCLYKISIQSHQHIYGLKSV